MTYTYTYRDRGGALRKDVLEATSRAHAFEQLKSQGVSPISLVEGGKPKSSASDQGPVRPSAPTWMKGAIAGVLVCVLAGVAFFALRNPAPTPKTKTEPVKQKVEKPKPPVRQPRAEAEPPVPPPVAEKAPKKKPASEPVTNVVKTADGREIRTNEKGEKILCVNPRDPEAEAKIKPLFKHEVESALAMYVKPAVDMPPLPRDYTDEEVRAALADPVTIDMENDSEDLILSKRTVQAFKEELKKFMEDGGTFNAYMRQLQKRQENEAMQMRESRKMIEKCLDENKQDEARQLLRALNKHLGEQGIPPIRMTPKYRKLLPDEETAK